MEMSSFNIFNFNAYRSKSLDKLEKFLTFLECYDPIFTCIQEIHVFNALKAFSSKYQVFINLESESKDGIGIVTLVKNGIFISDAIIAKNGRIIGLKISNIQIWNVYPQSGSANKK